MTQYQKLLKKQRFWNFFHKIFPLKKYYFVATVREEKCTTKDGKEYLDHNSRTWGFYKSKKKAIRSVLENWTDMNEDGYYHWAVIGTYNEGIIGQCYDIPEMWFEEDFKKLTDEELKEIYSNCPDDLKEKCRISTKTGYICWYDKERNFNNNFYGYKPCATPEWAEHFTGWAM